MPTCSIENPYLDTKKVALLVNRGRAMPRLEQAMAEMNQLASGLVTPRAAYRMFEVREVTGENVTFRAEDQTEKTLRLGPKADLLAPAQLAMASVTSIGGALEAEVKRLNQNRDNFNAYVLDCLGVAYLNLAGKSIIARAEHMAAEKGWGIGRRLAPGSLVGWDLRGQKDICQMAHAEEAGIMLSNSGMLIPVKSATALIGLGPGYTSKKVGRVCEFCSLKDTCWTRRL